MTEALWVGAGGFLGANARYLLGSWLIGRLGGAFPYHTLLINISGSLAIGLVLGALMVRADMDPAWRLFLVVGFLGGYTTFSSYSFELVQLLAAGAWRDAALYGVGSNLLSFLGTIAGLALARSFSR